MLLICPDRVRLVLLPLEAAVAAAAPARSQPSPKLPPAPAAADAVEALSRRRSLPLEVGRRRFPPKLPPARSRPSPIPAEALPVLGHRDPRDSLARPRTALPVLGHRDPPVVVRPSRPDSWSRIPFCGRRSCVVSRRLPLITGLS